jgi:antitoxin MazE
MHAGAMGQTHSTIDGSLPTRSAKWHCKRFTLELPEARNAMPMSEPVMEALRSCAWYRRD